MSNDNNQDTLASLTTEKPARKFRWKLWFWSAFVLTIIGFFWSLGADDRMLVQLKADNPAVDIDKYIQEYTDKNNSMGTILIKKDGRIKSHKSFGMANLQFQIPNSDETKFKIASITKVFTAVLILQLFEQKKIDLNAPIKDYLPDYTGQGADRVTIHHLLTHTSGIKNAEAYATQGFEKEWHDLYQKPYSIDQIIEKYCSGPLINEPGTKFEYNNGDYMILGKIIETIHGKPFRAVLQEQLLDPLNMADSGMFYASDIIENIANTYKWDAPTETFTNDSPAYIENWHAAAAMYSTAHDLLKFSDALFNNKIISNESLQRLVTPFLNRYGYGTEIQTIRINGKDHKVMQRYGRIRGANTVWFRFLDQDLTIIIFSNSNSTDLGDFAHGLARRLSNQ